MNTKPKLAQKKANISVESLTQAKVRLKKLRGERDLVERTILALTALTRTTQPRGRRAARN